MKRHTGQGHEALLATVLASSEDPREALAGSSLGDCPACAELLRLRDRMNRLGAVERAQVSAHAEPRAESGRAEQAPRAEALAALEPAQPRSARRLAPWIAAAAAFVAALGLWTWVEHATPPGPDAKLRPALELLHPLGRVDDFTSFRWTEAGQEGGSYRVLVQPLDDGDLAGDRAPTDSGRILGTSWEPAPEVWRSWGKRIRWTLEVHRANRSDLADSQSASAELSSH